MENDLKGIENYFELTGSSSYRGFELPGVDCILISAYRPDLDPAQTYPIIHVPFKSLR